MGDLLFKYIQSCIFLWQVGNLLTKKSGAKGKFDSNQKTFKPKLSDEKVSPLKSKSPLHTIQTFSLPKANSTKPRKLLNPELSNET